MKPWRMLLCMDCGAVSAPSFDPDNLAHETAAAAEAAAVSGRPVFPWPYSAAALCECGGDRCGCASCGSDIVIRAAVSSALAAMERRGAMDVDLGDAPW